MNRPLLYRAALRGVFGKRTEFSRGSITDALFVYLDGEPEEESADMVDSRFRNRPRVCLKKAWEEQISMMEMVGRIPGISMCQILRSFPAPSIMAASCSVGSMPVNAAR